MSMIIIFVLIIIVILIDHFYYLPRFYPGISIGHINAGGKTSNEVQKVFENKFENLKIIFTQKGEIILTSKSKQLGLKPDWEHTWQKAYAKGRLDVMGKLKVGSPLDRIQLLSSRPNIPVSLSICNSSLSSIMLKLANKTSILPQNAPFDLQEEIEHQKGTYLRINSMYQKIIKAWKKHAWDQNKQFINIELEKSCWQPSIHDDFFTDHGITEHISSFTTHLNPEDTNRNHNIYLSSLLIDEYILYPGEILSFNRLIGKATDTKGYLKAPVIIDGKLGEGIGGGLCQVSTTLYNAALKSGLEIMERHNHTLPVSYVGLGRDAAVAYDYLDLKMQNALEQPIIIKAHKLDTKFKIDLYGGPIKEIEIITTNKKEISPSIKFESDSKIEKGDSIMIQEGTPGYEVTTWRIYYKNNQEEKREKISVDIYHPQPTIYKVAPEELN